LTPLFFIRFIRAGLNTTIVILEKQKLELWINAFMITCMLGIFFSAYMLHMDIVYFLMLFTSVMFIINLVIIFIYFNIAKKVVKFV